MKYISRQPGYFLTVYLLLICWHSIAHTTPLHSYNFTAPEVITSQTPDEHSVEDSIRQFLTKIGPPDNLTGTQSQTNPPDHEVHSPDSKRLHHEIKQFKQKLNIALAEKRSHQPPILLDISSGLEKPSPHSQLSKQAGHFPFHDKDNLSLKNIDLYGFVDNIPDASPPAQSPTLKKQGSKINHDYEIMTIDINSARVTHNFVPGDSSSDSVSSPQNRFNPNFDISSTQALNNYVLQNSHLFEDQALVLEPGIKTSHRGKWILIDTSDQIVYIMNNDNVVLKMENISLGRNGTTWFKVRDDERTPLGEYRINWINKNSQYRLFFGLDYPTIDQVDYAYQKGLLDHESYSEILSYFERYRNPPQTTLLGGNIGIHGIGQASLEIHQQFNWTRGCIALTNQQIDQLAKHLEIGTVVVIK